MNATERICLGDGLIIMKLKPVDVETLQESEEAFYDVIDRVTLGESFELRVGGQPAALLVPIDQERRLGHVDSDWNDPAKLLMALTRQWIDIDGSLMDDERRDLLRRFDSLARDYFAWLEEP